MDAVTQQYHYGPHPNDWSEEREGRLTSLYYAGLPFSLIAAEIGVTRSAAIGKARRLKLPKRGDPVRKVKKERPPRPRMRIVVVKPPPAFAPKKIPEPLVIPGKDYTVTIDELTDGTCRYPLWRTGTPHNERFYCGAPGASFSVGLPYCRRHRALCWPH